MPTEGVASFVAGDFHRGFVGLISNGMGVVSEYRQWKNKGQNTDKKDESNEGTLIFAATDKPSEVSQSADQYSSRLGLISSHRLAYPVIIPQRRPGVKKRGFLRAYAPMLQTISQPIDEATFLKFFDDFDKARRANPMFAVVSLAAEIVGFVPDAICMAVSACVKIASEVSAELQSRKRTNTFLDKANEELFMPHGLYCMIMKYKPAGQLSAKQGAGLALGVKVAAEDVSDDQPLPIPGEKKKKNKFSIGDQKTVGILQLPECAPLVFPELEPYEEIDDNLEDSEDRKRSFKDSMKTKKHFMSDYADRRAHMNLAARDGASSLLIPEEKRTMKNRLADPNDNFYHHPVVKLLMGGVPRSFSSRPKEDSSEQDGETSKSTKSGKDVVKAMMGLGGVDIPGLASAEGAPGQTFIKNALMENLLYLAIVDLPTQEEVERAKAKVAVELEA